MGGRGSRGWGRVLFTYNNSTHTAPVYNYTIYCRMVRSAPNSVLTNNFRLAGKVRLAKKYQSAKIFRVWQTINKIINKVILIVAVTRGESVLHNMWSKLTVPLTRLHDLLGNGPKYSSCSFDKFPVAYSG